MVQFPLYHIKTIVVRYTGPSAAQWGAESLCLLRTATWQMRYQEPIIFNYTTCILFMYMVYRSVEIHYTNKCVSHVCSGVSGDVFWPGDDGGTAYRGSPV